MALKRWIIQIEFGIKNALKRYLMVKNQTKMYYKCYQIVEAVNR